jgi:ribosomal protein S18 acetylase RimI-like enzyme
VGVESASEKAEKAPRASGENAGNAAAKEHPPLTIERLTHQDVPEVVQLFRKVWEPYLSGMPPEVQKAWQPSPLEFTSGMEGVTYFAAKRGGKIIGLVGCRLQDGACHLQNVCVESDARRGGIGTSLLAAATGWAQHANAKSMYADVLDRFAEGRALFRASGFTEAGVLHRHFFGEDVRMFEKIL